MTLKLDNRYTLTLGGLLIVGSSLTYVLGTPVHAHLDIVLLRELQHADPRLLRDGFELARVVLDALALLAALIARRGLELLHVVDDHEAERALVRHVIGLPPCVRYDVPDV